jgi:hypothetical protein
MPANGNIDVGGNVASIDSDFPADNASDLVFVASHKHGTTRVAFFDRARIAAVDLDISRISD